MTSDKRSEEGVGFGSLPLPDEHLIDSRKDSSNNTAADMMSGSSKKKTRVVIKSSTSSDTNNSNGGGYDDFLGYLQSSTAPGPQSKKQKEQDDNHSESSDDISWSDILDGNTSTTATTTNRGESPDFTNFINSLNIQETPANRKIKAEKEEEAHEIFLEFWNSEAGSKARLDNNFKVFNNIQKNSPEAIWSEIVAGMQNGEVVEQPFWSSLKSWFGAQPSTAAVVEGKQHEQQPEEITDMSSFEEEIV